MRRGPGAAPGRGAAAAAGAALLLLYATTAAPGVTFWDAGEFIAAFHTLGIPHPPGTPLFVLLGRAWTWLLGPLVGTALAANLLSAAATAAAAATSARLLARWTGGAAPAAAGALAAGAMSTAWLSATETEVYAAALCLAWLAVAAGDAAGRRDDDRRTALAAFLLALAVPLHLSALVAAPAVALLAADGPGADDAGPRGARALARALRRDRLLAVGGSAAAAAGLATARWWLLAAGVAAMAAAPWARGRDAPAARARVAARTLAATALGLSPVLVLLVRARQHPALDQGHPATWGALVELVAREQYAVQGLWPRSAPWWLQLGNLLEWADWQVALALHPYPEPAWGRTSLTAAFALLGVAGAVAHRRRDARSWRALLVLLGASSVGVVAWLNLRAGPSYGWGIIPDDAVREARERDYFFALAFWVWGLWAGVGAVALARRAARAAGAPARVGAAAGVALAALPVALNWRAVTRRVEPEASLPRAFGRTLLASAPPRAVLLLGGDIDTYVVWHAQLVHGERPDVTPVTLPLLGAPWYRTELARRASLLPADAARRWEGEERTARQIVDGARRAGRPVAASAGTTRAKREALGGPWTLRGVVWVRGAAAPDERGARPPAVDSAASAAIAARLPAALFRPVRPGGDGVAAWVQGLLRCPALAAAGGAEAGTGGPAAQLDSLCNYR